MPPDGKKIATAIPLIPDGRGYFQIPFALQEREYLRTFLTFTTRDHFGFSEALFWTRTILQTWCSDTDASVQYAVLALGCLYETMNGQPIRHYCFALQQNRQALAKLPDGLSGHIIRPDGKTLTLILLSFCLLSFVGDHGGAIDQLHDWTSLFNQSPQSSGIDDEIIHFIAILSNRLKSCNDVFRASEGRRNSLRRSLGLPHFRKHNLMKPGWTGLTIRKLMAFFQHETNT